jgi:uncharacterized protein (DUF2267 family)
MSSSGLEAIDRSMHKTYEWISDLASELGSDDRQQAYRREELLERLAHAAPLTGRTEASFALEACARVLRRHVSDGEVRDVLENLPDRLRASLSG